MGTWPGEGAMLASKAEENCKVMRKVEYQGSTRVVVKCNNDREYAIPQEAQCVVGTVSIHPLKALPIGSPNRKRWLGMAPRSGLWQRKTERKRKKRKKKRTKERKRKRKRNVKRKIQKGRAGKEGIGN